MASQPILSASWVTIISRVMPSSVRGVAEFGLGLMAEFYLALLRVVVGNTVTHFRAIQF